MMTTRTRTLALGLLLAATPAFAQKDAPANVDPDPEIERKSFQVADGFEVNLFAADPLLAKPIQMNFDPAGRLWVATSEAYPQIKPGEKQNDKIIILEDTKGDRRRRQDHRVRRRPAHPHRRRCPATAAPTSSTAPTCCISQDTDGDGKADKRARRSLRLRHRGHAPHGPHAALGAGRAAVFQPVDLHSQPHRNAARRPRR